ncbi:MAG: chemotaxis protein CheW [Pseudomonadota bacterium]
MSTVAGAELVDCWNRIGVRGDLSCEKLVQHVHCRNCEVYAGAAQRNLQRPVGEGYGTHWAEHFRQPEAAPAANDSACLVFRIGREWLAIPARTITSVAPTAASHRLPHRSGAALTGIVNVGGTLLPSISLAGLLDISAQDDEDGLARSAGRHTFARLVVMQWEGQDFALPVAELHGIVRYAAASIKPPPSTVNKGLLRFISGVLSEADMHVGVLDIGLLGHQMTRLLR